MGIVYLLVGFGIGVVLSPLAMKLFGIGWTKLEKDIDRLNR